MKLIKDICQMLLLVGLVVWGARLVTLAVVALLPSRDCQPVTTHNPGAVVEKTNSGPWISEPWIVMTNGVGRDPEPVPYIRWIALYLRDVVETNASPRDPKSNPWELGLRHDGVVVWREGKRSENE